MQWSVEKLLQLIIWKCNWIRHQNSIWFGNWDKSRTVTISWFQARIYTNNFDYYFKLSMVGVNCAVTLSGGHFIQIIQLIIWKCNWIRHQNSIWFGNWDKSRTVTISWFQARIYTNNFDYYFKLSMVGVNCAVTLSGGHFIQILSQQTTYSCEDILCLMPSHIWAEIVSFLWSKLWIALPFSVKNTKDVHVFKKIITEWCYSTQCKCLDVFRRSNWIDFGFPTSFFDFILTTRHCIFYISIPVF